ncbi:MAG: FAD binding domain-containing protein [Chloroflexota bacterium]
MLTLLNTLEEIQGATGEIRAGGTDLHDRYRMGISSGAIIDIHKLDFGGFVENADGSLTIGASVTIDDVGQHPAIQSGYGALAQAANGLATPQIRWAASFGGSLLQKTRCSYFRHPDLPCTKKGDAVCGGRKGHHPNGVVFDNGGCAHAHASTLATALLIYNAMVKTTINTTVREMPIADLYGDGTAHDCDHLLDDNEILTHITLPPAIDGEKTAYFRSISRFEAEWPIVECSVRLVVAGDVITDAGVGVGGVSQIPLRLSNVEAALIGQPATQATLERAAGVSGENTSPLPQSAWKVEMMVGTILHALEMALN